MDDSNTLKFFFTNIQEALITDIAIKVTNFINPWSAVEIPAMTISSFADLACSSGQSQSQLKVLNTGFEEIILDSDRMALSSTPTVLGDTNGVLTIQMTPDYMSLTGSGLI